MRREKLTSLIRELAHLLEDEAAKNPPFAARLDALLGPTLREHATPVPRTRRSQVVPDVLSVLQEKGEEEFRFWLRSLDLATFKAIIKANGFDVARASQKWTDPDKFINLIAEQAVARLRRGASFLPPSTKGRS
jgi:hypothetical protein